MNIAILLLGALAALGRFTVPGHGLSYAGSYEAIAHIIVGFLIGIAFNPRYRALALVTLAVITFVETVAFLNR